MLRHLHWKQLDETNSEEVKNLNELIKGLEISLENLKNEENPKQNKKSEKSVKTKLQTPSQTISDTKIPFSCAMINLLTKQMEKYPMIQLKPSLLLSNQSSKATNWILTKSGEIIFLIYSFSGKMQDTFAFSVLPLRCYPLIQNGKRWKKKYVKDTGISPPIQIN
jgi:hypothetical protein